MKKNMIYALAAVPLLVLAILLVLGRDNVVYGRGRGLSPARYRALPAPARAVADAARAALAEERAIAVDHVAVLGVDPVSFPDTSLGVIEPGKRHLEAPTPGYAVRFLASGKTFTYHGSGDRIILVPAGSERAAVTQHLLRASISDLQERASLGLHELVVQRIDATVFPDGSLGTPQPGVPYPIAPTPGYDIRLQAKGAVYRYWAAGDRVVYVGSFLEMGRRVTVYLHRDLDAERDRCAQVYPVERIAPVSSDPSSMLALQQLFGGPTEDERAQGYISPLSGATADMLVGIRVEGGTAYLDLADGFQEMFGTGDACDREAFRSEVEATLKEILPVEWVVYSIDGDLQAFCRWMQWCE